jgi:5-methylcytosine-specific restriction endonuclease McrA
MRSLITQVLDRVQGKAPKGAKRSPHWHEVKEEYLKNLDHPNKCELCGNSNPEVHHKIPFHIAPDKELDPSNLIALCRKGRGGLSCHLAVGHLGNYSKFNPNVEIDVLTWKMKLGFHPDEKK